MRLGSNPLKYKPIAGMPELVSAVITHLPVVRGYHANRFEIVKACLLSMRDFAGGDKPHILVWDNGSCSLLTEWLLHEYKPDTLILSPNVGKSSAMAGIFKMFPPQTIIACSDDDMLFYPYWLGAQLEVMRRFPPAVVSGYPNRFALRLPNNSYTLDWAKATSTVETGKFISDQSELQFAKSLGRDKPLTPELDDIRINWNGMMVYAESSHAQFVTKADYFAPLVEWDAFGSADENHLDNRINDAGLLRLTTITRYSRHMGNVLDPELREDIETLGIKLHHAPMAHLKSGERFTMEVGF